MENLYLLSIPLRLKSYKKNVSFPFYHIMTNLNIVLHICRDGLILIVKSTLSTVKQNK